MWLPTSFFLLLVFLTASVSSAPVLEVSDITEESATFTHPGLLHTAADFDRVRQHVQAGDQPWLAGWYKLTNNTLSQSGYKPSPVVGLCRGLNAGCEENYSHAFRDYSACYQHALRWKISGDTRYADGAVSILNAWSSTMTSIIGLSPDRMLAAGIYGYQYANCVELIRDYSGFSSTNLSAAIKLLTNVYWPSNQAFLQYHLNQTNTHYWANWDLCNMASALSIGVVADDKAIYNFALNYFYNGTGMGSIKNLLWVVYPDGTAQLEESGRDQGHTMLDLALIGPYATAAFNQGTDLWSYNDSIILKGAEYAAKYNLLNNVSYTPFLTRLSNGAVEYNQTIISNNSRGDIRPTWEMYYNQYAVKRNMTSRASYTTQYADLVRKNGSGSEGGGGNYGTTSGGYDQLGFGTLMYTLEAGMDCEATSGVERHCQSHSSGI